MYASPVTTVDRTLTLGKATSRAAMSLGLTGKGLAEVIGVSEPTVSRIKRGELGIDPDAKSGELSLLLVRAFRSLDALVGGDDEKRKLWMSTRNRALDGVPIDLVKRADGLVRVVSYLDVMRAPS